MPHRNQPCPVARSLDIVGDRWSLLIIRDVFDGIHRFSDLQRSLGIARNILSDRLRKLVDDGVLALHDASDGTAWQEYVLTAEGEALFPVVVALRQWGEQHLYAAGEPHSLLLDTRSGKPLARMLPRTEDGTVLPPAATHVQKLE